MDYGDNEALMLPSSVTQQRLYLLSRLNPAHHAYNLTIPLRVDGVLPVDRWRSALERVAERHEALRTTLRLVDGRLLQRVDPRPRVGFETLETADDNAPEHLEALRRFKTRPFDLEYGPLLRCLVATGPGRQQVIVSTHHSVCDGVSLKVVLDELTLLMADPDVRLPEVELQFGDYATWEEAALEQPRMQGQVDEWATALQGVANPHRLPLDHSRAAGAPSAAELLPFTVEPEQAERVRRLAKEVGCSEFSAYLALVQLWLHKVTGDPRVAVGVPVSNRSDVRLDGAVGCFANTFAVPFAAKPSVTVAECILAASRWVRRALADQSVPFDRVGERGAGAARSPADRS